MEYSPLKAALADYDKNFINYWNSIFSSLADYSGKGKMWMAGPTAYVFSLCSQKFAVDLQIRRQSDFEKLRPALKDLTKEISFILITHEHDDHMCLPLMEELKDTDIHWYIPHDCKWSLVESTGLKEKNITRVKPGDSFEIGEVKINAFYSPHVKTSSDEKFAQRGYKITSPHANLLFPGDVRDYDFEDYPEFKNIDLCFSHLWAGNNSLKPELYMPMLGDFARFSAHFGAKKYFLCHLYEIGREEKYLWRYMHAGIAKDMMYSLAPESTVEIPKIGNGYDI